MKQAEHIDRITGDAIRQLSAQYENLVRGNDLATLEPHRARLIPTALQRRRKAGDAYLTKEEVVTLVTWKLKHGKFRPNLLAYAEGNDAGQIKSITRDGFAALEQRKADTPPGEEDIVKALNILTKLKGIGPATASLLLSCYDPVTIPFFADELYRWATFASTSGKIRPGEGWDRRIQYALKEYRLLVESTQRLQSRLSKDQINDVGGNKNLDEENATGLPPVGVLDFERAAYVLARSEQSQHDQLHAPSASSTGKRSPGDGTGAEAALGKKRRRTKDNESNNTNNSKQTHEDHKPAPTAVRDHISDPVDADAGLGGQARRIGPRRSARGKQ